MTTRFHSKSFILGAIAGGIVVAFVGLRQGGGGDAGPLENNRITTATNKAVHNDGSQASTPLAKGTTSVLDGTNERRVPVRSTDDEDVLLKKPEQADSRRKTEPQSVIAAKSVEKPKLVAGAATVKKTDHGLVAAIPISTTTTQPIGQVVVVAFLPPGSDGKILDLSPAGDTAFTGIDKRLSENGLFAAFQGTAQHITNLSFHLSVSQPVTATIKGNCGIEPFEIDFRKGISPKD